MSETAPAYNSIRPTDLAHTGERPGAKVPIFLPRAEVERRVGLRRSAIYRRMQEGKFPQPVHDIDSATVWWLESEIEAWQRARIAARDMGTSMGSSEEKPVYSL